MTVAHQRWRRILREVTSTVLSQVVFTLALFTIIVGVTITIVLTNGRAAAIENDLLENRNSIENRTVIFVPKEDGAELRSSAVTRIERLPAVDSVIGTITVADVQASESKAGQKVGMRYAVGRVGSLPLSDGNMQLAYASQESVKQLGYVGTPGTITTPDQQELLLTTVPSDLSLPPSLQPFLITPYQGTTDVLLSSITVVVDDVNHLENVTIVAKSLLGDHNRGLVGVESPASYAELLKGLSGQLSAGSHRLLVTLVGGSVGAVMVVVAGFALLRRRELGRRRVLGATRLFVVGLLVAHVGVVAGVGAVVGLLSGCLWLFVTGNEIPPATYNVALVSLVVGASCFAAIVPSVIVTNHDPLSELRQP